MVVLILGMLLCIALAVSVVGVVAVPARREGRELLRTNSRSSVAAPAHSAGANRTAAPEVAVKETAAESAGEVVDHSAV